MNMKNMRVLLKTQDPSLLLLLEIWEDETGQKLVSMMHSILVAKVFAFITYTMFIVFVGFALLFPLTDIFVRRDWVSFAYIGCSSIYLLVNLLFLIVLKREEWSIKDQVFGKKEGLNDFIETVSLLEETLGEIGKRNKNWPESLEEAGHLESLCRTAESLLRIDAFQIKILQNSTHQNMAKERRARFDVDARNLNILTGSSMDYGIYFREDQSV